MFFPDQKLRKGVSYTAFIEDCADDFSTFELSLFHHHPSPDVGTQQQQQYRQRDRFTIDAHLAFVQPFGGKMKDFLQSFKERILTKRTVQVQFIDVAPAYSQNNKKDQNLDFQFTVLLGLCENNNNIAKGNNTNMPNEDNDQFQKSPPPFISPKQYSTTRDFLSMLRTNNNNNNNNSNNLSINIFLLRFGLGFFSLSGAAKAHLTTRGTSIDYQVVVAEMLRYYLIAIKNGHCGVWDPRLGVRKEFERNPGKFLLSAAASSNNNNNKTQQQHQQYELIHSTSTPFYGRVFYVSPTTGQISLMLPNECVRQVFDALCNGSILPIDSFSPQHLAPGQPVVVSLANNSGVTQELCSRCALPNSRLQRAVVVQVLPAGGKNANSNGNGAAANADENTQNSGSCIVSLTDVVGNPLLTYHQLDDIFEVERIILEEEEEDEKTTGKRNDEQKAAIERTHQRMLVLMNQSVSSLIRTCSLAYFRLEKDNEAAAQENKQQQQQQQQPPSALYAASILRLLDGADMKVLPFYLVKKRKLVKKMVPVTTTTSSNPAGSKNNSNKNNNKNKKNTKNADDNKEKETTAASATKQEFKEMEVVEFDEEMYVLMHPPVFVENDDDDNSPQQGFDYQYALQLQKRIRLELVAQFDLEAIELAPTFLAEVIV